MNAADRLLKTLSDYVAPARLTIVTAVVRFLQAKILDKKFGLEQSQNPETHAQMALAFALINMTSSQTISLRELAGLSLVDRIQYPDKYGITVTKTFSSHAKLFDYWEGDSASDKSDNLIREFSAMLRHKAEADLTTINALRFGPDQISCDEALLFGISWTVQFYLQYETNDRPDLADRLAPLIMLFDRVIPIGSYKQSKRALGQEWFLLTA
ncbi:MAG: hypothetical protein JWM56_974 [Candidatus Peribacteria bacterium]|nr:hypothetical protein [Candidatus Peribacteria bacterium]